MQVFLFDETFDGLLTCVFEAYRQKCFPEKLLPYNAVLPLFTSHATNIQTDTHKATRVWHVLHNKLSDQACYQLLCAWFSEDADCASLVFRVIQKVVDNDMSVEGNLSDEDILALWQLAKRVSKEQLHLIQFVRFQKTVDDIYFAPVNPVYNALPLTLSHFGDRFADQKWIIYDMGRGYGYFYDLNSITEITLNWDEHFTQGQLKANALADDEKLLQTMWQKYFKALTIQERLNPRLHRQHMPRRFWRYLTEKQSL